MQHDQRSSRPGGLREAMSLIVVPSTRTKGRFGATASGDGQPEEPSHAAQLGEEVVWS